MNVRELRDALAALGPEYDESMIMVSEAGMSGPGEATRLITIPLMANVDHRPSYEVFEKVVWIDTGGSQVSRNAEENEGWRVPYYNPTFRAPSPLTRTPREQYEEYLKTEAAKRHVACGTCLGEWQRGRCVPKGIVRLTSDKKEFCCHCGAYTEPAAVTVEGKRYCEGQHGESLPSEGEEEEVSSSED